MIFGDKVAARQGDRQLWNADEAEGCGFLPGEERALCNEALPIEECHGGPLLKSVQAPVYGPLATVAVMARLPGLARMKGSAASGDVG